MRDPGTAVAPALFALALFATSPAAAGDGPGEKVSFDEAVARAVAENRDIARAAAAILRAEALLRKARATILPTVEVFAAETVIDAERGSGGFVVQPRDQFSSGLSVSVPVLAASRWAARAQAADRVEIANLEAAEVRRRVATAAAEAYLAILAARRRVEVEERARDFSLAQRDYAKTRLDAGAGSRLDAVRAEEVLASDEAAVARARLALDLAREGLGVLLAADRPVDAGADPALEAPEGAWEDAIDARPDLRLLAARRDAADRVLRDSWKDWVPDVVATFDPLYVDPAGAFQDKSTWRAVVAARFPLYLGGERGADRLLREAALEDARIDLDEAGIRARSEIRSARASVDAAEGALVHAREAASHAAEALAITEAAFRAGARTNLELVDAQRRARDAETAVARAEDGVRRARLDLLVALGRFPG